MWPTLEFRFEDALTEPWTGRSLLKAAEREHARGSWQASWLLPRQRSQSDSYRLRSHVELPEMRLEIVTPPTGDPVSLAVSPMGRKWRSQRRWTAKRACG